MTFVRAATTSGYSVEKSSPLGRLTTFSNTSVETDPEHALAEDYPDQERRRLDDVNAACVQQTLDRDRAGDKRGFFSPWNNCWEYVAEVENECREDDGDGGN